MKNLIALTCLSLLAIVPVYAQDAGSTDAKPAKTLTPQQQKMKDCNAEAKSKTLKGAERKTFMKGCLSAGGKPAASEAAVPMAEKKATQKEKMKTCNADAKSKALKGDERKAFMKDCLSAK